MILRIMHRFCKALYRLRPEFLTRSLIVFVFLTCFWNEFLSYEFSALIWIVRLQQYESDAVKILVVADPQLLGYRDEPGPFKGVRRWDADRYLKNGFTRALRITNPDAVIFLGDLFDEGVKMSVDEFEWTLDRFNKIFEMPDFLQRAYIPGDNDIGGEGEPVLPRLLERFQNRFINHFDLNKLGLIDFDIIHVNGFADSSNIISKGSGNLKIVLSHLPLLRAHGSLQRTVRNLNPSLILSAHDHTAEIYQDGRTSYNFYRASLFTHSRALEVEISKDTPFTELQTPTCSYRMGVPDMGYGLLWLRRDKNEATKFFVKYHVLWLPRRFIQLTFYAIALGFSLLVSLRLIIRKRFCFKIVKSLGWIKFAGSCLSSS